MWRSGMETDGGRNGMRYPTPSALGLINSTGRPVRFDRVPTKVEPLAERRRDVKQAVAPSQHHHDREFAKRRLVAIRTARPTAR